jgi:hypothetical protein
MGVAVITLLVRLWRWIFSPRMRVWHLSLRDYDKWDVALARQHNQTFGAVVVAATEKEARRAASEAGGEAWLDETESTCDEIIPSQFAVTCLIMDEPVWGENENT